MKYSYAVILKVDRHTNILFNGKKLIKRRRSYRSFNYEIIYFQNTWYIFISNNILACRTTSITLQVYINFCNMNQWSHVPCRIYNTSVKRYRWYGHIATYGDVWVYFRCRDRDSDNTHFVNPVFVVHWSQSIYSNKTSYCER